ncbi:MAG: hypothetical protein IKR40_02705 [Treponema sp.]|nr:hypothetical protein [Treponema sp.]
MKKIFIMFAMLICAAFAFAQTETQSAFEYDEEYEEMLEYGEYEDIIEDITERGEPYSAADNYYMGIAYFATEDFESAAKYLEKTVEMLPDFLEARDTLAGVYYYAGEKEKSIAELKKCIELNPEYTRAYFLLEGVYEAEGRTDECLSLLKKMTTFTTGVDLEEVYYYMTLLYIQKGDYDSAERAASRAVGVNDGRYQTMTALVYTLYLQKKYSEVKPFEHLVKSIWRQSEDMQIAFQQDFYMDSFTYGGYKVDVYEILSEQDFPYNYWCAEVYDMNKVSVRSINLESTEELRKEGKAFVISSENYAGSCREVTDITFDKLPSYEEFIKIVKDGIDGKLNYVSSEKIEYSDYNFSFGVDETDEEDESEADDSESEDDEEPMFSDGEFTIER